MTGKARGKIAKPNACPRANGQRGASSSRPAPYATAAPMPNSASASAVIASSQRQGPGGSADSGRTSAG